MSNFNLSNLANLLLKNQQELMALSNNAAESFEFGLKHGALRSALQSCADKSGGFNLNISDTARGLGYRVEVPGLTGQGNSRLTLTDFNNKTEEHPEGKEIVFDVKSSELLSSVISPPFNELHTIVVKELSRVFGEFGKATAKESPVKKGCGTGTCASGKPCSKKGAATKADDAAAPPADSATELVDYIIRRKGEPDLRFKGNLLAQVGSGWIHGRRFVYSVYVTKGGKFVAIKQGVSARLMETDRNTVAVFEDMPGVVEFFGFNSLAKALYEQLNLESSSQEFID